MQKLMIRIAKWLCEKSSTGRKTYFVSFKERKGLYTRFELKEAFEKLPSSKK